MNCDLTGSSNIRKQVSDLFLSDKKKIIHSKTRALKMGLESWLVQQLRVSVALTEDLGLVPSTHIAACNHWKLQFQVPRDPITRF